MIHYAVAASELTDGFQRYKLPQQDGNSLNGIRLSLTGFCSERRTAYIGNELAGVSNGIRKKVRAFQWREYAMSSRFGLLIVTTVAPGEQPDIVISRGQDLCNA